MKLQRKTNTPVFYLLSKPTQQKRKRKKRKAKRHSTLGEVQSHMVQDSGGPANIGPHWKRPMSLCKYNPNRKSKG
jgi:hypothetical protein